MRSIVRYLLQALGKSPDTFARGNRVRLNRWWIMNGRPYLGGGYWPSVGAVGHVVKTLDCNGAWIWVRFDDYEGKWPVAPNECDKLDSD